MKSILCVSCNSAVIVVILLLSSCSDKNRKNNLLLEDMIRNLEKSNIIINRSSEANLHELREKLMKPESKERAEIWYPKAQQIQTFSQTLYDNLGIMKTIAINKDEINKLYKKISDYRQQLLSIDKEIEENFTKDISFAPDINDSSVNSRKKFNDQFIYYYSTTSTNAVLTRLQNDIKIIEAKLLAYCNLKCNSLIEYFTVSSCIVGQNSTYLRSGETLEIKAGVGAFSKAARPEIIIDGKKAELTDSGFSRYKMVIAENPGEYKVPVIIKFFDQISGKQETIVADVKYTVVKECDQ